MYIRSGKVVFLRMCKNWSTVIVHFFANELCQNHTCEKTNYWLWFVNFKLFCHGWWTKCWYVFQRTFSVESVSPPSPQTKLKWEHRVCCERTKRCFDFDTNFFRISKSTLFGGKGGSLFRAQNLWQKTLASDLKQAYNPLLGRLKWLGLSDPTKLRYYTTDEGLL